MVHRNNALPSQILNIQKLKHSFKRSCVKLRTGSYQAPSIGGTFNKCSYSLVLIILVQLSKVRVCLQMIALVFSGSFWW